MVAFWQKNGKNVQFEKVADAAPTAIFYNEDGEEVERVLLEGLSRCHDVDEGMKRMMKVMKVAVRHWRR